MTSNSHVLWITCKHNTNTVQCGLNDTCLCHNKGEVNISHGACRVFYSKRERKRKKPVLFLLSSMTKAHIRYWVIAEIFYRQENMLAKNNPSLMLNPQPDRVWTPNLRAWAAPSIRCCHEFRQAGHEQCVLKYSTLFGNCSIKPKSEYLYTPAIISPQNYLFQNVQSDEAWKKRSPYSLESFLNRALFFCPLKQVLVQLHPSKLRVVTANEMGTKVSHSLCGTHMHASDFILSHNLCLLESLSCVPWRLVNYLLKYVNGPNDCASLRHMFPCSLCVLVLFKLNKHLLRRKMYGYSTKSTTTTPLSFSLWRWVISTLTNMNCKYRVQTHRFVRRTSIFIQAGYICLTYLQEDDAY